MKPETISHIATLIVIVLSFIFGIIPSLSQNPFISIQTTSLVIQTLILASLIEAAGQVYGLFDKVLPFLKSYTYSDDLRNALDEVIEDYNSLRHKNYKDIHGFHISNEFFISRINNISSYTDINQSGVTFEIFDEEAYVVYNYYINAHCCNKLMAVNSIDLSWWDDHDSYIDRNVTAVENGRINYIHRLFVVDRQNMDSDAWDTLEDIVDGFEHADKISISACYEQDVGNTNIKDSVLYYNDFEIVWDESTSGSDYNTKLTINTDLTGALQYHKRIREKNQIHPINDRDMLHEFQYR